MTQSGTLASPARSDRSARRDGYGLESVERRTTEAVSDARQSHESSAVFRADRARVLHTPAFRRLAGKTQVERPGASDGIARNRLTHSLEVGEIARRIGSALGCNEDLVDVAGLVHDIGHPPFGHNGELALDEFGAACGGFEGNAQTFRVLTRLEVADCTHSSAGLNLTRASLDATLKYPWRRGPGSRKYCVYDDDLDAFEWVRSGAPTRQLCLEAQIMDCADDIAYSIHDVEDGIQAHLITLDALGDAERAEICEVAATLYSPLSARELAPVLDSLMELAPMRKLAAYDDSYSADAAVSWATAALADRFVTSVVAATEAADNGAARVRHGARLVVPDRTAAECALLKAIAAHLVMHRPQMLERQDRERMMLTALAEALATEAPHALDRGSRAAWHAADSDAARTRVVLDQIAQLTDFAAIRWHAQLVRPR